MPRNVTILGAGLVGSLLSVILRKRGYSVEVYERRSDMRNNSMSAGRSINLAMSARGWKALELAGLREALEPIAIPMYGRSLHQPDGTSAFQAYGKNNEAIYSVSRGELNKRLMSLAEESGAQIHFEHACTSVQVANNQLHFNLPNGEQKTVQADLLLAADGAFSALRTAYTHLNRVNYSQTYLEHGYKELTIPPLEDGTLAMEQHALHIWPRKNFMLIALPNTDGTFTCTLFLPFDGPVSFAQLTTPEAVTAFFATHFPDTVPLMPTLVEDFFANPTASLATMRVFPWRYKDQSALIGDSAHAIVPFYGQGMNAGFEDCTVLDGLLGKHGADWNTILAEYERLRKPSGDAVAQLALNNFIEMRDKVADPAFLVRKKIEKELGLRYPSQFVSVYEMVSFSHIPYQTALQCTEAQDTLLQSIMGEGDFFTDMAKPGYMEQLDEKMNQYYSAVKDLDFGNEN
ncbi:MAG: FAD-dependent monooxygenase [Chitinophagia bacterium]|nr:FAD-dependent monooxygenase [Chitinophagia bacterium]